MVRNELGLGETAGVQRVNRKGQEERGGGINDWEWGEPCRGRAMPGPALRADIAAQAQHYGRAVPGTGTMLAGLGRAFLCRAWAGPSC